MTCGAGERVGLPNKGTGDGARVGGGATGGTAMAVGDGGSVASGATGGTGAGLDVAPPGGVDSTVGGTVMAVGDGPTGVGTARGGTGNGTGEAVPPETVGPGRGTATGGTGSTTDGTGVGTLTLGDTLEDPTSPGVVGPPCWAA